MSNSVPNAGISHKAILPALYYPVWNEASTVWPSPSLGNPQHLKEELPESTIHVCHVAADGVSIEKATLLTFENKMADVQACLEPWCSLPASLPCTAITHCSRQESMLDAVFAFVSVALSRIQRNSKKNELIWRKMFRYELPINICKLSVPKGE